MGIAPLGILVLEHDPLKWSDFPAMLSNWAQNAGGFAFFGLIIYVAVKLTNWVSAKDESGGWPAALWVAVVCLGLSIAAFGAGRGIQFVQWLNAPPPDPKSQLEEYARTDKLPSRVAKPQAGAEYWADMLVTVGGALALFGFGVPFCRDLFRLRTRRIGALARLSFKEAVRRRVVWAPVFILLVFLFPPKWFFQQDPKAEISTYVAVIYWAMTPIMLLIVSLLAAFAIPTDMKNQTIHTVVTKPVERFEIVLGRSLGYIGLASVILVGLTGVSLILLWASDPSEEAKYETYKARVPVYGDLEFRKLLPPPRGGSEIIQGESVGREWEYRRYIPGADSHRAVWSFDSKGALNDLANRDDAVPCEFSFDIFRTTKGDENKGVTCTFEFVALPWGDPYLRDARREQAYQDAKRGLKEFAQPGDPDWPKIEEIAEKFGYYRYPSKEVFDYHTFDIKLPQGLFRAALQDRPAGVEQPRLLVIVKCESPTQFLGLAKRDLYLLAGDEPFWLNFLKGVFGLWLRLVLVITVAVACSTYLSGVVAWLLVWFLYTVGMFQDYIAKIAGGTSVGGGPAESLLRLATNQNITTPIPDSAGKSFASVIDVMFQWVLRRIMDVLPDVEQFSWAHYVASGFAIPWAEIVINTMVLAGYLLPWAILGYYLMKSREVAA